MSPCGGTLFCVICFTPPEDSGPWHGIAATGRAIRYAGVTIARLEGGQVVEHRTLWDTLAVLEQLGVAPVVRKEDGAALASFVKT